MKILYLIDEIIALNAGGTERQILQMAKLMQEAGNQVELCVLRGTEWLDPQAAGLKVHFANYRRLSRPAGWLALLKLVRWMRGQEFDVLQTFFVESNLLGPWLGRLAGVPVILGSRRNMNYWMTPRTAFFQGISNKLVTRLVANCEAVKNAIANTEGAALEKIDVLYNGVDLSSLTDDAAERQRVRQEFGLSDRNIVIGSISTLRPVKGVLVLLDAAEAVIRAASDARFILVGDGPLRAQIQDIIIAKGLNDLVFLAGSQKDVRRYLRAFDIAVLASESEGFSNSLLEYVAMGLPSVVTDVGGNREAVAGSGWLVPPKDPAALADALLRLIRSPDARKAQREAGLLHSHKFSLENAKQNLDAYYHSLMQD